jgi:predicted SAM-dependent methyltransferase
MKILRNLLRGVINKMGYDISFKKRAVTRQTDEAVYSKLFEDYSKIIHDLGLMKIHYGCGSRQLDEGWINVDQECVQQDAKKVFLPVDLAAKHPFPSNLFKYGFAEDFLEHLEQSESILFLCEVFRTFQPHGIIRLSFPGLRGVLKRHYRSSDYQGALTGQQEAYIPWRHRHFYCKESLEVVACHIGFSKVNFVEYGISEHEELRNLDSRIDQKDLIIYAELTKQKLRNITKIILVLRHKVRLFFGLLPPCCFLI